MGYFKERWVNGQPPEAPKPVAHKSVDDCRHERRDHRYGDRSYPQWVCRDCPYEYDGVERKPMTAQEIKDSVDLLFGPERS